MSEAKIPPIESAKMDSKPVYKSVKISCLKLTEWITLFFWKIASRMQRGEEWATATRVYYMGKEKIGNRDREIGSGIEPYKVSLGRQW